ncbi:hypothetical protein, partial [Actinomadura fibrosa]
MDYSSAADELYGVDPADFVATRTRLAREAREAGDAALAKRIGALRRPTLPAWAVNLLARDGSDDLGALLEVGERMRAAWGSGGGMGGLGDLEQRRARLVDALVRRAGELAAGRGSPLRDQAVRDVEDTLFAASMDAGIADEVREGRLSQPRSHTGFVPAGFPVAPGTDGAEPEPPKRKPKPVPKAKSESKAEPETAEPAEPGRERPAAKAKTARADAARARRAETLRKHAESLGRRAEKAERDLAEREDRAGDARRQADAASAEVGRLRHEL